MNHPHHQLAKLERVAEEFCQVYFIYDLDLGQFSYLNQAFKQVFELNPEVTVSNPALLFSCLHPEDQEFMQLQFEQLLAHKKTEKIEFRIITPTGEIKWLCMAALLLAAEPGESPQIGGFLEDITKRREITETALKFNAKKDATLEILSHDLASPFLNIEGLTTALEEQWQEGDLNVAPLLKMIRESAKKGSDLIRDFVHTEFLESSQVVLNKERVDIVAKIAGLMENYQSQQTLINREFRFKKSDEPIYMYLDELKFMQVMNNLLSNAIKFTHENGIITVTVTDGQHKVLITVTDNGIGIPAAMQPFLFDKFTKARRPGIRGEKSTGLGMSIIKNIVEWHQGKIWFESTENVSTTFYVQMPVSL